MTDLPDRSNLLSTLLDKALKSGADAADAVCFDNVSISHAQRLGEIEKLERAESNDLGLRVLIGKRQAIVSSTDFSTGAIDELVDRAVAMARSVPEDPYTGLAEPRQLATSWPDNLDLADPVEPTPERLIDLARRCEDAARSVEGVTNSEGAEAGWDRTAVTLAGSNGFAGGYARTSHYVSASVIAGEGTAMETDYDYSHTVHGEDLEDPEKVGRSAGERAVAALNPKKASTAKVPVIFDPRVSASMVGHLAGAINGAAIARGTSFLKDHLGKPVFADGINIVEDPHRPRGLRSKAFDAEGVANTRRNLIDGGALTTWLMDLRSAAQIGAESTGHAARGTSSPPSPSATNLWMEPGAQSPAELMAGIDSGLYITSLIGFGVNGLTGDYSRGAAGFWIENGEKTHAVSELTIAGNLRDMFLNITPASDLVFKYATNAPTIRIDGMTVAGQ